MRFLRKYIKKILIELINKKEIKDYLKKSLLDHNNNLKNDNSSETENSFFSNYGYTNSTKNLKDDELQKVFLHFQYKEKAKVALSVVSSYWGGDYLEFGSHDMYTFRNFLSSFHVSNLIKNYPDTNFYAFDIFGSISNDSFYDSLNYPKSYFQDFMHEGDIVDKYKVFLDDFGIYRDKCFLIKGLFEETLPNFKHERKIGFVCLDCNIIESYKTVLNWLESRLNHGMYIYVDEYFDNGHYTTKNGVYHLFQEFIKKAQSNAYDITFIRSAAGVGALFRVFKKF